MAVEGSSAKRVDLLDGGEEFNEFRSIQSRKWQHFPSNRWRTDLSADNHRVTSVFQLHRAQLDCMLLSFVGLLSCLCVCIVCVCVCVCVVSVCLVVRSGRMIDSSSRPIPRPNSWPSTSFSQNMRKNMTCKYKHNNTPHVFAHFFEWCQTRASETAWLLNFILLN